MSSCTPHSCTRLNSPCARTSVTKFVAHSAMYMHVNITCSSTAL
jgi:hypothetical protein